MAPNSTVEFQRRRRRLACRRSFIPHIGAQRGPKVTQFDRIWVVQWL